MNYQYQNPSNPSLIPMKPPNAKSDVFQILQGKYEFTRINSSNPSECISLKLPGGQIILVEVFHNVQFPPRVFYNNQEIQTKWNNNLLDLIQQAKDKIGSPYKDIISGNEFLNQLYQLKLDNQEDQILTLVKQSTLPQLIDGITPQAYPQLLQEDLTIRVRASKEYLKLKQILEQLLQLNDIELDAILKNDEETTAQLARILEMNSEFQTLRQNLMITNSMYQSLKDRVDRGKIIQNLDKLKNLYVDEENCFVEESLNNDANFEEDVQKYFQFRKEFHKLEYQKQKLNSMSLN
ncbi:hypothetical protein pb186bvf_011393 [Paramecium bursaria]